MSNDEPRKPRPSPTSRARRIGGAAPRPAASSAPADDTAVDTTVEPATEPATEPAPEPTATPTPEPQVSVTKPRPAPTVPPPTAPDTEPGAARGIPARWVPAGVLGLAVLTLLVLIVVFSHGVYWSKPDNSTGTRTVQQEKVLAAAKKCFVQINSYDYQQLDGLLSKDLACTTGTFTSDLKKALQTQVIKLAPKFHAQQTAQVNKAGIVSVSSDGKQVVTLIYGQFSVVNDKTGKKPRLDVVGAVVTVNNVNGNWLIAKVDADVPAS